MPFLDLLNHDKSASDLADFFDISHEAQPPVRKTPLSFEFKNDLFYQDRLGTRWGNAENEVRFRQV